MRIFILLFTVTGLTACATAYQPEGFSGGFTETQLDKNVFRVSFQGNGYTRSDRAEEMALLRSAELTRKNGFTHFVIVDGRSRTDYSSFTTPAHSSTTGTVSSFGSTGYLNAQTRTTGGQTFTAQKPSTTNTIICFAGKPDIGGLVYDAQFLFKSLAPKYGVAAGAK